jgi:hypothetical protein
MIKIISQPIPVSQLQEIAQKTYGNLVKAVVDIKKEVMAIGGELHADEEALLLEKGSQQEDVWGINLYLLKPKQEWIEFDSIINLRPSLGNLSRDIESKKIKEKITKIISSLIKN